jgi:hypothetical protein
MKNNQTQPALLISYGLEKIEAVEPVLVPIDWDFTTESLPFTICSNQAVSTDKIYLRHPYVQLTSERFLAANAEPTGQDLDDYLESHHEPDNNDHIECSIQRAELNFGA